MLQGKNAASQKWSFIREQKPDEVLFIQFFDSHADKEGTHGSPVLIGSEEEELRESVGSVVIALLLRAGR
jgi:GA4 desaturase